MTMERTELTAKIEEKYKKMSKGHKRIADYIRQNYDKAAFMTANKLGGKVGVSESTVVRFADSLGYDGYPQLQRAMQDVIRNRLTTVQLIEMTGELKEDEVLAKVREYVESLNYFKEVLVTRAGCVISSHCGYGTLGILYVEQ